MERWACLWIVINIGVRKRHRRGLGILASFTSLKVFKLLSCWKSILLDHRCTWWDLWHGERLKCNRRLKKVTYVHTNYNKISLVAWIIIVMMYGWLWGDSIVETLVTTRWLCITHALFLAVIIRETLSFAFIQFLHLNSGLTLQERIIVSPTLASFLFHCNLHVMTSNKKPINECNIPDHWTTNQ